jgi:uncharacterized protein YqgV (UPF0045/DUF77 family)
MARLLNPTPMDMGACVYGTQYRLPAKKIAVIKELILRRGEETHGSEEVARLLMDQLAPLGLRYLNEDDPMPVEEHLKMGQKEFVRWGRRQIKEFNDLNLKQASESLATQLPGETLMEVMAAVKEAEAVVGKVEAGDPEFVSQDYLSALQAKESQMAVAKLQAVTAAMQTGDMDAVKAALGRYESAEVGTTEPDPTREIIEPVRPAGKSPGKTPSKLRQAAQAVVARAQRAVE